LLVVFVKAQECVCTYMHVCAYVWVCEWVGVHVGGCKDTHTCFEQHLLERVYVYVSMCVRMCERKSMSVGVGVDVNVNVCLCVYTHTHK